MNILQLAPQFPFPADDGGKISIANIYDKTLELGHNITMISISKFSINEDLINKYKKSGHLKVIVKDTKNTKPRVIKAFLQNKSLYIDKHYSKNLIDEIEDLVNINDYDIIHSDHTNMAKIGLEIAKKYDKIFGLRLHNVEYMIWKRFYVGLGKLSIKRIFIRQQFKLLQKAEQEFIENADVSFAISYKDRERALELAPNSNVVNASAGVNLDEWIVDDSQNKVENSLVIATTFNWIHNVNALNWFIDNVQPELVNLFPNVKLSIIGKNAPTSFDNYKDIGVNKLGYVEDIKPFLNSSQVYIAPLFVGSGIRIKILEAMAMKLPVVATDISAEGIEADEKQGLFRVNNRQEFVDTISKLFRDNELRRELGENARKFVSIKHDWKENVNLMMTNYQLLVSSK